MKTFKKAAWILFLLTFVGMTNVAHANKSVFIISKHGSPSLAQAYAIDSNEVVYQDELDISGYNQGYSAVANAVWPDRNIDGWPFFSDRLNFF